MTYIPRPGTLSLRSSRNMTMPSKVKVTTSYYVQMSQGHDLTWRVDHWGTFRGRSTTALQGQVHEVTDRGVSQGHTVTSSRWRSSRNMPRCRVHSSVTTPVIMRRRFMVPRASMDIGESSRRTPSTTGRLSVPDGVMRGNYTHTDTRRRLYTAFCDTVTGSLNPSRFNL